MARERKEEIVARRSKLIHEFGVRSRDDLPEILADLVLRIEALEDIHNIEVKDN